MVFTMRLCKKKEKKLFGSITGCDPCVPGCLRAIVVVVQRKELISGFLCERKVPPSS